MDYAFGVVYTATNLHTGERYVGQTRQKPSYRFCAHKAASRNPKSKFHNAISEYGYATFFFEVVASAANAQGLNDVEKLIIGQYNPEYNATRGGAGRPRTVSIEERAAMSARAKARWADPLWRQNVTATMRKLGASGVFTEAGRRGGKTGVGAKTRWAGHTKTEKQPKNRSASMSASWGNPDVRARRISGLVEANKRPEVIARRSAASTGRKLSDCAIAASAKAKWKPVYCPELQVSFLSRSAAASYIGVHKTTVSEAIRHNRKIAGAFTLREVSHRL